MIGRSELVMYKNQRFLSVIPARCGSKGIPQKNIIDVQGKPLIQYTIEEALRSKYLDKTIVSTDCEEIASISSKLGADVPFIRPKCLAQDTSKSIDVLLHAINFFEKENKFFDYIVLLQPTQPLRKSWHIDGAIEKIVNCGENGLVSVTKVSDHPVLMRTKDEKDKLSKILNIDSTIRRQDFPNYYKVDGSIYINKINNDFNESLSLNDNPLGYEIENSYSIDVDEPIDLEVLKIILTKNNA